MQDGEESAPEQIEEGAPEVEWGAEVQDFVKTRLDELGLNEQEVSEETEEVAAEVDATEEAPEPEATPEEPASRTARRLLQKETKLREERDKFKADQDAWRAEQAELTAKIESFEQSAAAARLDPIAHLEGLGLESDELLSLAREVYYRQFPDEVSAQAKSEMSRLQQERRLKQLESKLQKPEPEPEPEEPAGPTPEQKAYVENYRRGLTQAAVTIDAEQFPNVAAYAKTDFNDLVDAMYTVAVQAAQSGEVTQDLTPDECIGRVESWMAANMPQVQATPQQTAEPEPARPKAITNKVAAARPSDKHESDLSYEELKAKARERFYAKLGEGGLVRD